MPYNKNIDNPYETFFFLILSSLDMGIFLGLQDHVIFCSAILPEGVEVIVTTLPSGHET
jgi:hypothetical protein